MIVSYLLKLAVMTLSTKIIINLINYLITVEVELIIKRMCNSGGELGDGQEQLYNGVN